VRASGASGSSLGLVHKLRRRGAAARRRLRRFGSRSTATHGVCTTARYLPIVAACEAYVFFHMSAMQTEAKVSGKRQGMSPSVRAAGRAPASGSHPKPSWHRLACWAGQMRQRAPGCRRRCVLPVSASLSQGAQRRRRLVQAGTWSGSSFALKLPKMLLAIRRPSALRFRLLSNSVRSA
jgi:hypothetical protein